MKKFFLFFLLCSSFSCSSSNPQQASNNAIVNAAAEGSGESQNPGNEASSNERNIPEIQVIDPANFRIAAPDFHLNAEGNSSAAADGAASSGNSNIDLTLNGNALNPRPVIHLNEDSSNSSHSNPLLQTNCAGGLLLNCISKDLKNPLPIAAPSLNLGIEDDPSIQPSFFIQSGLGSSGQVSGISLPSNPRSHNLVFVNTLHQGFFFIWDPQVLPDSLIQRNSGYDAHQKFITGHQMALSPEGHYYVNCLLEQAPANTIPPSTPVWSCLYGSAQLQNPVDFKIFQISVGNPCASCLDLSVDEQGQILYSLYDDSLSDRLGYVIRLGSFSIQNPEQRKAEQVLVQITPGQDQNRARLQAQHLEVNFNIKGTVELKHYYDGTYFYLALRDGDAETGMNSHEVGIFKFNLVNSEEGFIPHKKLVLANREYKNIIRAGFLMPENYDYNRALIHITKMRFRRASFEMIESLQFPQGEHENNMEIIFTRASLDSWVDPLFVRHFPYQEETAYQAFSLEPFKQDERYMLFAGLRSYRPGGGASKLDSFVLSYAAGEKPISRKISNLLQTLRFTADDPVVMPLSKNEGGSIALSAHIPIVNFNGNESLATATEREWFANHPQDTDKLMLIRLRYSNER